MKLFEHKVMLLIIVSLLTIHISSAVYDLKNEPRPLTVGLYTSSDYRAFRLTDAVAAKLNTDEGLDVSYISGIGQADYDEWLAERFITGNEPDVIFVPPADFAHYAQMGALMNLDAQDFSRVRRYGDDVYGIECENFVVSVSERSSRKGEATIFLHELEAIVAAK